MSNIQGNIIDNQGNKLVPNTSTVAVLDVAKNQALSATLIDTPDKSTLGYASFLTTKSYSIGDIVYKDNKLWQFTSAHPAGAWNSSHVTEYTIAEQLDNLQTNKANIDGSYDTMSVGMAKNLEGKSIVTESFLERTSGGEAEIANGLGALQGVEGNSQVWNQLLREISSNNYYIPAGKVTLNGDKFLFTGTGSGYYQSIHIETDKPALVSGHTYLFGGFVSNNTITSNTKEYFAIGLTIANIKASFPVYGVSGFSGSLFTAKATEQMAVVGFASSTASEIAEGETCAVGDIILIDLTLLGIDNLTTVEEVEAWLAENIGEQDYYPYEPGTVLNANLEGIESSGFNLLDPATGKAELIGVYSDVYDSYYGITGTHGAITFTDRYGNTETVTPDEEGKFLIEKAGTLTVASAGEDCAVFLWWDGTRTEYEPYEMNVGNLDVKHIYGKLDGGGDYVQVWPTGMPGIGDIKDTLKLENGEVVARRNIGEVDMGSLNWGIQSVAGKYAALLQAKSGDNNLLLVGYTQYPKGYNIDALPDLGIKTHSSNNSRIYIRNDAYTDVATFTTAMSGVPLYYELATPQVYTDLIYQGSSLFADGTPVTLPVNYKVNNWGIERVLPKNTSEAVVTSKPTLTCRYSIDAVEQLDTMQTEIEHLDEKKPNKYGDYPDMAVGSAKALAGNNKQLGDFVFTDINAADGIAKLDSVRGKSLVWNQLKYDTFSSFTQNGVTMSPDSQTKRILLTGTGTGLYIGGLNILPPFIIGHKYYYHHNIVSNPNQAVITVGLLNQGGISSPSSTINYSRIFTASATGNSWGATGINGVDVTGMEVSLIVVDLTLMFGAGNEPTTVAEFEKYFPLLYYDHNAGNIKNNMTTAVKFTGFNQWDEEWESGYWNQGAIGNPVSKAANANYIRCKEVVPCLPNTTYYVVTPSPYNADFAVVCVDADINKLSLTSATSGAGFLFTTPAGCTGLVFYGKTTTYNNDICINISDAARNGEYEPHKETIVQLDLTTKTGKLNGEGSSVVVFPDGMKNVGSTYDEAQGSTAIKKIGKRAYQSGDESDTSVVTDGTDTLYVLTTPEEYTLVTPLPETFQAYKGGTMMQLPQNGSAPTTAPMVMEWTGALDAVSILTGLPQNYVSKESLQAMLGAMQSAGLFASYTMTFDETNNRYAFTFTPNPTE